MHETPPPGCQLKRTPKKGCRGALVPSLLLATWPLRERATGSIEIILSNCLHLVKQVELVMCYSREHVISVSISAFQSRTDISLFSIFLLEGCEYQQNQKCTG